MTLHESADLLLSLGVVWALITAIRARIAAEAARCCVAALRAELSLLRHESDHNFVSMFAAAGSADRRLGDLEFRLGVSEDVSFEVPDPVFTGRN